MILRNKLREDLKTSQKKSIPEEERGIAKEEAMFSEKA